jgi:hypothetical protein
MLFLIHLIARALARPLAGSGGEGEKDLEIVALRHQLKVLRRRNGTSALPGFDRAVLSAVARVPPASLGILHGHAEDAAALAP